jgi:hypothetical protein
MPKNLFKNVVANFLKIVVELGAKLNRLIIKDKNILHKKIIK